MFCGIIEELGVVKKISRKDSLQRLTLKANITLKETEIGSSVAVNGVCLTVIEIDKVQLSFEIMNETWKLANLQFLKEGEKVNLERSLRLDSRLSGHFVSGHIDGLAQILEKSKKDEGGLLRVKIAGEFTPLIAQKGSVALDGVSLTVAEVSESNFVVYLIPHTFKNTTLGFKQKGDFLNLEVDLLARYVQRRKEANAEKSKISEKFLKEHGFV